MTEAVSANPNLIPSPATRGRTARRRWMVMLFVLSPLAVLALLVVLIALSLEDATIKKQPPVGAGAGETGMSNQSPLPVLQK